MNLFIKHCFHFLVLFHINHHSYCLLQQRNNIDSSYVHTYVPIFLSNTKQSETLSQTNLQQKTTSQRMSEVQQTANTEQQVATAQPSALATTTVSSVKTVKHTKKVSSSSRSSATKKVTKTVTGSDGVSNSTTAETVQQEKKSAAATSTTATTSTTLATGEVKTESSSSNSATMSASRSIIVKQCGKTYSEHLASISSGVTQEQQALGIEGIKAALANYAPNLQLQELVLVSDAQPTVFLKPEDLTIQKDGGKAAVLNFNISEFESQTLEVKTDGNKVQVHAKKKHVNPEGEERSEEFSRVYQLPSPDPIDPASVTTSVYQDGVLTIELPIGSELVVVMEGEDNKKEQ